MTNGDFVWKPPKDLVDSANITSFLEKYGFKSYKDFIKRSIRNLRWFWGIAPDLVDIQWFKKFSEVLDISKGIEWTSWYINGKLNASYNVLDKHVERGLGGKRAFTWIGEDGSVREYTYGDLKTEVDRFVSFLISQDVGKGDVVSLYMPMMPEAVVAMLAALRVGAIVAPIFSGFSPPSVADRLRLSDSKIVVTVDGYIRRGRVIEHKRNTDEAILLAGLRNVNIIVVRRLGIDIPWNDQRDLWYHDIMRHYEKSDYVAEMDPNDPALLLFTSGTTGRPKGALISHIGSILKPGLEHFINLDIRENDLLWWITDIGWMMGPWQILGSQLLGASHLMIEGAIDYPPDRVWSIIEKHRVTHLGFAATAARILRSYGNKYVEAHDLSSLRVFGNTGEPIDPETWWWVMRDVGELRRPLINLSGGTEVFGCIILPSVITELKPSTLWGPAPGVDADVFDEEGRSVRGGVGYLVVKKPFPSMTRGLWRDPERYIETYWSRFSGVWYHGDWAYIDPEGYWYLLGRADDVIKTSGMRVGAAELEGILNTHPKIAESACIGVPHEIKGEVIYCFAKSKLGVSVDPLETEKELKELVINRLSKVFVPEKIFIVEDLPRTRSGKIMRRVLRALVTGSELGDVTTLENPESIEYIRKILHLMK